MKHSASAAAIVGTVALLIVVWCAPGEAVDRCQAWVRRSDGTIFVTANDITGALKYGDTPGTCTSTFVNDPPCVAGDRARNCRLGAEATLAGRTPPADCTIDLCDGGATTCEAYVRGCTPAVGGGGGGVLPTCTGNEVLTSNGTLLSCVAPSPTDISVRVDNSTNISILNGLLLPFDSELWDTGCPPPGMHDPANPSRLTACVTGKYYIFGQVAWAVNVNGFRQLQIDVQPVSGDRFTISNAAKQPLPNDGVMLETSTYFSLNAGDYVELYVIQNSGGPLDVLAQRTAGEPHYSYSPVFGMVKLP